MVREIIHLQVGQCGNQIGNAFWESITKEHQMKFNGEVECEEDDVCLQKATVYFREKSKLKFVPRGLLIDLEPGTSDVVKKSAMGSFFAPDNYIFGHSGAGNNWAKGHYTEGAELVDNVIDAVRKEADACDCVQGFQICHSLGGGTGSGMGTLVLLKIRDAYPDRITTNYSVFPSPKVSDTVVEPYNAVLSSHQLLENSDETFMIDNEALYNIAFQILKDTQPDYAALNVMISKVMCGITASLRFPGQLNGDLRKLGVNLVPFPRLHFFLQSYAPIAGQKKDDKTKLDIKEVCNQVFEEKHFLAQVKEDDGKTLALCMVFRGAGLSSEDVDDQVDKKQKKKSDNFVDWIPNNIKTSLVSMTPQHSTIDCTYVCNTTGLRSIFQRLATQFGLLYKRKAFLHWYKGEGMDEMEFQEADKNVRDLITEYQDKQDATYDAASDQEEEDEDS